MLLRVLVMAVFTERRISKEIKPQNRNIQIFPRLYSVLASFCKISVISDYSPWFASGDGSESGAKTMGGAGSMGTAGRVMRPPPDGFVCKVCNIPGHWIQQCPEVIKKKIAQGILLPDGTPAE